jgi:hypothetical protein
MTLLQLSLCAKGTGDSERVSLLRLVRTSAFIDPDLAQAHAAKKATGGPLPSLPAKTAGQSTER